MNRKDHIFIGGNIYGAGNIGDDAVLAGIIRQIPVQIPLSITTLNGRPLGFVDRPVEYVDAFNAKALREGIAHASGVMIGGGTMIGDELGLRYPLRYVLQVLSYAKLFGKKTMLFSVGVNRLHPQNRKYIAKIASLCDVVTVRDAGSYAELRHVFPAVVCSADPAFLLEPVATERSTAVKRFLEGIPGKKLAVNVVNESWADEHGYKMAIAAVLDRLVRERGVVPVFICNEVRPGRFFDQEANLSVQKQMKEDFEVVAPEYYSPFEMIDILSSFEAVFSMRMHMLFFAIMAGVPVATVSRVSKVDNFVHEFGAQETCSIDNVTEGRLFFQITACLPAPADFSARASAFVAARRQRLDESGKHVDMFLGLCSGRSRIFRAAKNLFWELNYGPRVCKKMRDMLHLSAAGVSG